MKWEDAFVFISSTFNDMHAERDYLIKEVFPELTEWCEKRKIRLKDIDLRWGVTEEESSTNKTIETCLRHIDKSRPFFLCFLGQRRGWIPDFERDINPETMKKYDMGRLKDRSATEMEIEHALLEPLHISLREDFQDEYPTPTRHSIFFFRNKDYTKQLSEKQRLIYTNKYLLQVTPSDVMDELKNRDSVLYGSILNKLIDDFRQNSLVYPQLFSQLIRAISEYDENFYNSDFDDILVENPLSNIDIIAEFKFHNHNLYYDIAHKIKDRDETKYYDLIDDLKKYKYKDVGIDEFLEEFSSFDNDNLFSEIIGELEINNNKEFQINNDQLNDYKDRIRAMDTQNDGDVSKDKVHVIVNDYEGVWDKNQMLSELSHYKFEEGHGKLTEFKSMGKPLREVIISEFIEQFELEFEDHLKEVENEKNLDLDESIVEDIDQQEIFCYVNSEGFIERPEYTDKLKDYVENGENSICLVSAEAGFGKTMLLAKFAIDFDGEYSGKKLYKRFCGASDLSSDIYSLWKSLMAEAKISEDEKFYPKNLDELKRNIPDILHAISSNGDCVIIIDAVNQMPDGINMLKWFDEIPDNLKLIISVKEDKNDEIFNSKLQNIKNRNNVSGFEIRELDDEGKKDLINEYLKNYLKSLDDAQIDTICSFEGSKNPLFLKILLAELRVFGSFDQLKEKIQSFGETPVSAFKNVLERLEEDEEDINADKITYLIFSLLANARVGLSEDELKTIIQNKTNLDEKTIQDAIRLNLRQVRQFMARKEGRHDFFYESFKLAAQEKYADLKIDSNNQLAKYFKDDAELSDDYSFNGNLIVGDKDYLRSFSELPYHLDESENYEELSNVLSSYDFIKNKLELGNIYNLTSDYQFGKDHKFSEVEDHPIVLIGRALELSAPILEEHKNQLAAQLWGRMNGIDDEVIVKLLGQVESKTSDKWLKSSANALYSPKSSIIKRIKPEGRKATAAIEVTSNKEIVNCNDDGMIDIFNIDSNELETIDKGDSKIVKIIPEDNTLLVAYADGTIKKWDVVNRMIIKDDYPKIDAEITDIYLSKTYNKIYASSHEGIFTIDLETEDLMREDIEPKNYNRILVPRRNEAILVCDENEVDGWDVYEMRKAFNRNHQQNDDDESSTKLDSSEEIRFMGLNKRFLTLISENGQMKFWNTLKNSGGGESIAEERVCSINDKFAQAQTLEDENQIITISDMGILRVWDIPEPRSPDFTIATNNAGMELDIQTGITSPTAIDYFSDDVERWVVVGNENNDVSVIDLEKKVDVEENIRHAESAFSIKTDDNHMITASNNGEIFTWDIGSEECINQYACDFRFNAISYNRSDSKLVLAGFKTEKDGKKINKIAIFDVNGSMWQVIETDEGKIELEVEDYKSGMGDVIDIAQTSSGIVFLEENKLIIGNDEIKLNGSATTLATNFESDDVFVGFADGSIVKYPSEVRFGEISSPITKINVCDNNVIVGYVNGSIEILDLDLRNSLRLDAHDKAITNIYADESYLISLSKDNTIKFFGIDSKECEYTYYLDIFATSIYLKDDKLVVGDTLGNVRFLKFKNL